MKRNSSKKTKRSYNSYGVVQGSRKGYGSHWDYSATKLKEEVGNKCQGCGATNVRLQVHHIHKLSHGGTNQRLNKIVLCEKCHTKRHSHLIRRN